MCIRDRLDTYARKLAANMNHGYEIDARVPSILIAGGSNFPVRKKEKQNAARDSNMPVSYTHLTCINRPCAGRRPIGW